MPTKPPRHFEARFQHPQPAVAPQPTMDDLPFMGDRVAALYERPRGRSRWLLWSCCLLCTAAMVWAYFTRIEEFTSAEGRVVPASQLHVVQNLEGGILAEIAVQVGDFVKKEQVLMRIDDTRFSAPSNEGREREVALQLRVVRLEAESLGTGLRVPPGIEREFPHRVNEELNVLVARRQAINAQIEVLRQQAEQRQQEVAEANSRAAQLAQRHASLLRELTILRPLAEQGAFAPVEVMRLERQTTDVEGELDAARLAIPRVEAALREINKRIDETLANFRAEAMKELNLARSEQRAIAAANRGLVDRVQRTLVRAPVDGVVNRIRVTTPGGVIQPGMDLVDIVPNEDRLIVEARVRPGDIAFVKVGQPARVRLTAYDTTVYGSFPAVLEHVGSDAVPADPPNPTGEHYFPVRLRTHETILRWRERDLAVLPGMIAHVDIQTGEKTVLDFLLKPLLKLQQSALRER